MAPNACHRSGFPQRPLKVLHYGIAVRPQLLNDFLGAALASVCSAAALCRQNSALEPGAVTPSLSWLLGPSIMRYSFQHALQDRPLALGRRIAQDLLDLSLNCCLEVSSLRRHRGADRF